MIVTRRSPRTGDTNSMDIDVTQDQLNTWARDGVVIQIAMPNLTSAEREFIKTGYTQADWEVMLPEEDEA